MKTIIAGSRGIEDVAVVTAAVAASGFPDQIAEVVSGAALSYHSIAVQLNADGLTTRNGKQWSPMAVLRACKLG